MNNKDIYVTFKDDKLEAIFESLEKGKFEDKTLYNSINKVIGKLKTNPECGIKIPQKLWPKIYIQHHNINNLWKYNLPKGWRLLYTIKIEEIRIINVILEWLPHKEYEKRFKY